MLPSSYGPSTAAAGSTAVAAACVEPVLVAGGAAPAVTCRGHINGTGGGGGVCGRFRCFEVGPDGSQRRQERYCLTSADSRVGTAGICRKPSAFGRRRYVRYRRCFSALAGRDALPGEKTEMERTDRRTGCPKPQPLNLTLSDSLSRGGWGLAIKQAYLPQNGAN